MGRKHKNDDAAVGRITRPQPSTSRTRVVSMHTTATGRVGQSTSFLDIDPPALQADSQTEKRQEELDFANDADFFEAAPDVPDSIGDGISPDSPDTPLTDWVKNHCQIYLDELIRHDGQAGIVDCARCGQPGSYKCRDCFGFQTFCQVCFLEKHTHLPLHRALVRSSSHSFMFDF
jgi:hypothetical protein